MEKMANLTTTLYSSPSCKTSLSFYCPKPSSLQHHKKCVNPSRFKAKHLRISGCGSSSLKDCIGDNSDANDSSSRDSQDLWADSHTVEVIGIDNRVDSVLDFCLSSSHNLRFWNVITNDASRGQLQQRFSGKDTFLDIVDAPLNQQ